MSELYKETWEGFISTFQSAPDMVGIAPGRIQFLGDHTDYNKGCVLACPTGSSTYAMGRLRQDDAIIVYSYEYAEYASIRVSDLSAVSRNGAKAFWYDHVWGTLQELAKYGLQVPACEILVASNVPIGAGMSSSTALEVAIAEMIAGYNGTKLSAHPLDFAHLIQRVDNNYLGAPTGLLDQSTIIMCPEKKLLFMDFATMAYKSVPFGFDNVGVTVFDTKKTHDNAGETGYRVRKRECEEAVAWISCNTQMSPSFLSELNIQDLTSVGSGMPPLLFKRAKHIVTENSRVLRGVDAVTRGDLEEFGRVMNETHLSCRDDFENSTPEIDCLAQKSRNYPSVYGSKILGAGFGGCVVVLHKATDDSFISSVLDDFYHNFGYYPGVYREKCGPGSKNVALNAGSPMISNRNDPNLSL